MPTSSSPRSVDRKAGAFFWPPAASPKLQTAPGRQTEQPADRTQQHALWASQSLSCVWLRMGHVTS